MRMYASFAGPSPSPAARIVSRQRAAISASVSGTGSASMPDEFRRRCM